MNESLSGLTLKPSNDLLMRFGKEWISSDIIKVSLPIEPCTLFLNKLEAFGLTLPSSLAKAVASRKYEFMAGRACVKAAMNLMGEFNVTQLAIGDHREPIWPAGFNGSISHSATQAIALVVRGDINVGVDLQEYLSDEVTQTLMPEIVTSHELQFAPLFTHDAQFVTTVFSAKESLFKCMFRDIKHYVDFSVAELSCIDWPGRKLKLRLRESLSACYFKGREITVNFRLGVNEVETFIIG